MSSEEDIQQPDQTTVTGDNTGPDPEPGQAATAQPAGRATRVRTWPGVLGLFLALIAVGISGWLGYQRYLEMTGPADLGLGAAMEEQRAALSAVEQSVAELARQRETLASDLGSTADEVSRLAQRMDSRETRLGSLEQGLGRVDERTETLLSSIERLEQSTTGQTAELADLRRRLESAVEQMDAAGDLQREIDRELRRQMLMLEAAGLLRVGQDLAEVQGNWREAQHAFERARNRLAEVDDARLEPVRRTLAREIEALAGHSGPDLASQAARLERLGREVRDWPLQLPGSEPVSGANDGAAAGGWLARLRQTFGGLVRVERRDELGRDEAQFEAAREQLQLRLLAAELALFRGDQDALNQQIAATLDLIDNWFDTDAASVAAGRDSLEALAELVLDPAAPELGAALDQLQARLSGS